MRHTGARSVLGAIICVLAVVAAVACGGSSSDRPMTADGRLPVVATTTFVADLVAEIGGEGVAVESLMGAGVDPHLYKPSAGDVRRMTSARVVFYNGLHLEGKMGEVLAEIGQRGVVTTAVTGCMDEGRLISTDETAALYDPHVWFDVGLWMDAASCVGAALQAADPDRAELYRARAQAYGDELAKLDLWVREQLAALPPEGRVLITAHDAFAYFGRAYGVEVRGLLGVSTAAEAGTADVQELARFVVEREVAAVFVESSVSPRFVHALRDAVEARGGTVAIGGELYSDALGSPGSAAASYVGAVKSNVNTMVTALGGAVASAQ